MCETRKKEVNSNEKKGGKIHIYLDGTEIIDLGFEILDQPLLLIYQLIRLFFLKKICVYLH